MTTTSPPLPAAAQEMETVALPRAVGLFALWAYFGVCLRNLCRFRRLATLVFLFCLPAALVLLIRLLRPERFDPEAIRRFYGLEFGMCLVFIPQVLLPLTALLFASGMVQDEIEDQTLTYLLIRPLPRWGIYVVKVLAALVVSAILVTVFTFVTQAAIWFQVEGMNTTDWLRRSSTLAGIYTFGLFAYIAIFGFISLIFRRSLVIGAGYILIFEGLLANIPMVVREYTVMFYLRSLFYHRLDVPERARLSIKQNWSLEPALLPTASAAVQTLVILGVVLVILGGYLMNTREFRVKTPEGN